MPKKNTFWHKYDLQNAALAKYGRDSEVVVKADGDIVPRDATDTEDDGDQHMDESGGTKRSGSQAGLTSNSDTKRTTSDMEVINATPAPTLALRSGSAGPAQQQGSGETPVSLNVPRELGIFTETRTTILPLRFGFSFNKINNSRGLTDKNWFYIRMNAPYNILKDNTFVDQTEAGAVAVGPGVHQAIAYDQSGEATPSPGNNASSLQSFQVALSPPTGQSATNAGSGIVATTNIVPAWRNFYAKIYEAYTVLETEYRITFVSPEKTIGNRSVVYVDKDTFGSTSTGNVIPTDRYPHDYETWKNVDKHIIYERNNNDSAGWIKTISGVWKPNTWAKNVKNDADVKTWSVSGVEPSPDYTENLTLIAKTDEHTPNYVNLNVFVELRYIVQWKDLNAKCRYPYYNNLLTSALDINDCVQVPSSPYNWGISA